MCTDVLAGMIRQGELSADELREALFDIRAAVHDYPGQQAGTEEVAQ